MGGAIAFEPPLPPSYSNAIDSRPIVGGVRFWVEFSEMFYAENLEIFRGDSYPSSEEVATYYFDATFGEAAASGRNIITNLGIGQNSLAALSDDELIERVLDDLDHVYNGKARETYMQHRVQNWSAQPCRGVFSDDSPGVEPYYEVYEEPIDGRLHRRRVCHRRPCLLRMWQKRSGEDHRCVTDSLNLLSCLARVKSRQPASCHPNCGPSSPKPSTRCVLCVFLAGAVWVGGAAGHKRPRDESGARPMHLNMCSADTPSRSSCRARSARFWF